MSLPMTRTRGDIAQIKIKMLELYSRDPRITDAEICRLCKINKNTAAKYRKQLFKLLDEIRAKVAETEIAIQKDVKETMGIWEKISKMLG